MKHSEPVRSVSGAEGPAQSVQHQEPGPVRVAAVEQTLRCASRAPGVLPPWDDACSLPQHRSCVEALASMFEKVKKALAAQSDPSAIDENRQIVLDTFDKFDPKATGLLGLQESVSRECADPSWCNALRTGSCNCRPPWNSKG